MHEQSAFCQRELGRAKDLTQLHDTNPERYPFALLSTSQDIYGCSERSQYDILFAFPRQQLKLDNRFHLTGVDEYHQGDDFLDSFNAWFKSEHTAPIESTLPFTGGWFIYLAYELAQQIEPRLQLPSLERSQMVAVATRVPAAIIIDHHDDIAYAVAEEASVQLLDGLEQDYSALKQADTDWARITVSSLTEQQADPYLEQVSAIKRYIVEGDVFQANLSRQWQLKIDRNTTDNHLFNSLAQSNPASFACIVRLDGTTVISSSPERLVCVRDQMVETRPIAGTRPRSDDSTEDSSLSNELLHHPKEQAEHIMLIDLERNDLGRICQPGSIEVNELLTLETWQHVHHIVSNVRGKITHDVLPGDVLRAVFPGGTITGCPKVRCMEILAEQEQQARGAYTGTVGYINRDGSMDSNILIRTLVRQGDTVTFRAGGGIVADSVASAELAETRAKAKGLLNAFDTGTV